MFSGFSKVLISKSGIGIILGFLVVVFTNIQGQLGEMGTTVTWGAGILSAIGLALRHTLQKIIEMMNK